MRVIMPAVCVSLLVLLIGCQGAYHGDAAGVAARRAGAAAEARSEAASGYRDDLQSGTLTAGSLDDTADSKAFRELAGSLGQRSSAAIGRQAGEFRKRPIVVTVTDAGDGPLGGVDVRISAGDRKLSLITRTDGRIVLLPGWDKLSGAKTATLELPGGERFDLDLTKPAQTVKSNAAAAPVKRLDLAFVVDCTGSMSDELEYLKVEIRSIAQRIARGYPQVAQRFALVCYRDEGDDYVTRVHDFDALERFHATLGKQSAGGGGDYEEAVDKAFEAAGQLKWSTGSVARVLFHVADAPPHDEKVRSALVSADQLRKRGVAIYPVASSGVRDEAEFVMRSSALMTGGLYCFLTDDSGVGGAHAAPHAERYDVERLVDLMTRCVASEISGKRLAPDREKVIRTVAPTTQPAGEKQ